MGLIVTRRITEQYVPDVADNRARARKGLPAVVATIARPNVSIWREYQDARYRQDLERLQAGVDTEKRVELPPRPPGFDERTGVDGILFRQCVLELTELALDDGTPITTGAQLWDLADDLDREVAAALVTDLLAAVFDRATLTTGALRNLVSRSGSPVSAAPTGGTVETAAAAG
jgi:hypothetical protein